MIVYNLLLNTFTNIVKNERDIQSYFDISKRVQYIFAVYLNTSHQQEGVFHHTANAVDKKADAPPHLFHSNLHI